MTKPRLLDLFARAQGTSVGYARAGFDVTASDIDTYDKHPEVTNFITGDALSILADVEFCRTFDLITLSPPCQGYSTLRTMTTKVHPQLIAPARELVEATGVPYIIENVEGARKHLVSPVKLCGSMFELGAVCQDGIYRQLRRHRLFELSNGLSLPPILCCHLGQPGGVYGTGGGGQMTRGYKFRLSVEAVEAMGIDWMKRDDLSQAIPPAYTEWLGRQVIGQLKTKEN